MAASRSPGYRVRRVGTLAEAEPDFMPEADLESEPEGVAPAAPASAAAATAAAGASAPAPTGPDAASPRGASPRGWRSAARQSPALAVVAALGIAGTVGFGLAWGLSNRSDTPTAAVTTSARNLVLALTNFDPGTIRADFNQIQSDATGQFASQARRFFGASIRHELTAAGAASRGTVDDLYVQSVNGNHATVFAVVSQRYLNKDATSPVNDTLRIVMGMTLVNETWKTSSVQVLQQPIAAPVTGPGSTSSGTTKHKKS
jgi:hypothetical protein